jgi:hypothetical protein
MASANEKLDEAFDAIGDSILPQLSASLDALIESASLARPGIDADTYAERLRAIARDLATLSEQLETLPMTGEWARESYRAA